MVYTKKIILVILLHFSFVFAEDNSFLINPDFFSLHIHEGDIDNLPFDTIPFNSIRLWDADVRWDNVEPNKEKYNFSELDSYVEKANREKIDILMTLGTTPKWAAKRKSIKSPYGDNASPSEPKNIEDWRSYVSILGERYKGKIKYWEIWNEPDIYWFYSGSIKTMVELTKEAHQILKAIDPENKIVTPSISGWKGWFGGLVWLDLYLQMGGRKYIDVIGFHLYSGKIYNPDYMISYIEFVKFLAKKHKISDKPIWNTEANYHYRNITKPEAVSHLAKIYLYHAYCNIDRVYWYSWGFGNNLGGMVSKDTKEITYEGIAYQNLSLWLVGKEIVSWERKNNIWICEVRNKDKKEYLIWKKKGMNSNYTINENWNITAIYFLDGSKEVFKEKKRVIQISSIPIILTSE